MKQRLSITVMAALAASTVFADIRLAGVFQSDMVLQREMPVPVWGWADPGETVTVEFKGQKKTATAGEDGLWRVTLDALKADATPAMLVVSSTIENPQLKIENVLVGEVWIIAGQSNAGMALKECLNPEEEIAAANYPLLRHMTNKHVFDGRGPRNDVESVWQVSAPEVAGAFHAVPYFFGRSLHQKLTVPVGVIALGYGGSRIEAWMSRETLATTEWGRETIDVWQGTVERVGRMPDRDAIDHPDHPASIYNGKVAPLAPFALRGAIWYQGENNASDGSASHYGRMMPMLIADWRNTWQREDLPFLLVQLPNLDARAHWRWPDIREAVFTAAQVDANVRMVVTVDVGDSADIHPKNKAPVGERLALQAMNLVYGDRQTMHSGPLYRAAAFADGKATLAFDHVGGGLIVKDAPLREFTIAGADRKFVAAAAEIKGDTVVVHSPDVPDPVAVRYGWSNDPRCNLFNKAGLPASPFRTDGWDLPVTYPYTGCHRANRHSEIKIKPRLQPVVIDGELSDWDLSGAILMHMHEFNRDTHNCRAAMMVDDQNLYLACHVKDPTPMLNNYTLAEAGMAWSADAMQVYLYSDPEKCSEIAAWRDSPEKNDPAEQNKIAHLTIWYSTREQKPGLQVTYGLNYRDATVNPAGVEGAFKADADGTGYTLEYKIPIAILRAPRAYKPGDRIQAQFQIQWGRADGRTWRLSMTDLTNPDGFNPTGQWDLGYHGPIGSGTAVFE